MGHDHRRTGKGMKLFKRQTTIKLQKTRSADELLEFLFDFIDSEYSDCKCRGYNIRFVMGRFSRLSLNSGFEGSINIIEHDDYLEVQFELSSSAVAASAVFLMVVLVGASFAAYFGGNSKDPEKWIYFIAFPLAGMVMAAFLALGFRLFSYMGFVRMKGVIKNWGTTL